MKYLRELIAEHKRTSPAVLSGRFAEGRYGRSCIVVADGEIKDNAF